MRARRAVVWMAGILSLGACAESVTSPTARTEVLDGAMAPTATVATSTNLIVRPGSPAISTNNVLGVAGDPAPGYSGGSFASDGTGKTDIYFTPQILFGRDITLGEIASISYWTKKGTTHAVNAADWYIAIYTKPYSGQAVSGLWYGARIGSEPYFSASISDPANAWNEWTTDGAGNVLRFFESTAGATGATFGSYSDPHWSTFVAGSALTGPNGGGAPRATQELLTFSLQTGGGWADGFTGQLDGLRIELSDGSVATVNFEESLPACTTTCYVDAVNGSNLNGGASAADAKKTIQAAIDQVSAGGTVRVLPGTYNEVAPGSMTTSLGAPAGGYQFGLFFPSSKPGITLMGVTAADTPITSAGSVQATINTNATNNFGPSGVFVEGANTIIQGLAFGPNSSGDNKTIEVVADNFTLQYSSTAVPGGGAIYISEFDAPAGAVQSYHVLNNNFADATQVAISSGAGQTGAMSGREIKGNTFNLGGNTWPSISFNGSGGVPWFTKPVGGAIVTGNSFTGGGEQYIRSRGTVIESDFDWKSFWDDNTYDKGTVDLLTEAPFVPRPFSYTSSSYTLTNVRRIGTTIAGEVGLAAAGSGDVVLAKAGTYPESATITVPLTLKGAGIGATIMQGTGGAGTGLSLAGGLTGVTIQDLGVQGYKYGIQMTTGPLNNVTVQDVAAVNNTTHGIWVQAFGITNMAFTRVNASNNNAVGGQAGRGIWLINGVKQNVSITDGTFNNNGLVGIDISDGNVTGVTITGNTVIGNGDSGIGVLGPQGPSANVVSNNVVTNNGRYGIEVKIPSGTGASSGSGSILVSGNSVSRTAAAADLRDHAGIAVVRLHGGSLNASQPTGVYVTGNAVTGYHRAASGSTGDGFGIVVEGTNHSVTKNIVADNDVGIQIQDGNPQIGQQNTAYFDRGDATPSSALINRNSITNSTDHDVRNVGAPLTDATCNWYGAATGPVAAKISGNLTTSPWLLTSDLNGTCAVDSQGPVIVTNAPAPAPINTAITVSATISDLTTGNAPLASWEWSRDGAAQGSTNFATSAVTQSVSFSVPPDVASDVDEICVRGTDVYGNVGDWSCVLAVWYDPSAGFVTGGGWINSPAGAYTADPLLTGRASFGFVSKYQKGKTVPSGNAQFQFQAGNLSFTSTSYQWLVVSGARAQFKGTGTINDAGSYNFLLTAIDGSIAGGGGADKFRIKITDASGNIVYDNMLNAPDTSDPTTVLGGGNIQIHAK